MTRRPTSPATDALLAGITERSHAEAMGDPVMRDLVRREAARREAPATTLLTKDQLDKLDAPHRSEVQGGALVHQLQDNTYSPTYLTATAHKERLELAVAAGCGDLAMDATLTIRAENSLERMLAHQLAASHAHAMRLMASADAWLREADAAATRQPGRAQMCATEAARMTTAAARMMAAYQDGVAALARMRTGGQQVVTVQHVHVSDGGQAVVAGNVAAGRKRRRG